VFPETPDHRKRKVGEQSQVVGGQLGLPINETRKTNLGSKDLKRPGLTETKRKEDFLSTSGVKKNDGSSPESKS